MADVGAAESEMEDEGAPPPPEPMPPPAQPSEPQQPTDGQQTGSQVQAAEVKGTSMVVVHTLAAPRRS
jgi:hypothetical protein